MMNDGASGEGLARAKVSLFACELEGGSEALATELVDVAVVPGSQLLLLVEGSGAPGVPRTVVWGEPAFIGTAGEVGVLDLAWQPLESLSGAVRAWRAPGDRELLLGGRPCDAALLMTPPAAVRVRVPPGAERLVAECGFDASVLPGPLVRARCSVYRETHE